MKWDPQQYSRYSDQRSRPFGDLLARVAAESPRRVVDLGCGTGALTAPLAERWPSAAIEGIDSSEEMIAAAAEHAGGGVTFRVADIAGWAPSADTDVIVSNAALQWVPGHRELLATWAAALAAGGWLAIQVPGNFDAPAHVLLRELAESPRWSGQLDGVLRHHDAVAEPVEYAQLLHAGGLAADVWETTYLHVLPGDDPILEWLRGTGLRPVLAVLPPEEGAEFAAELAEQLRAAYPPGPDGTIYPFRRIFAVGHRS